MKVGDLVKVYDFSHKARQVYNNRAGFEGDVNAHCVGLIVATSDNDPKHRNVRRVLRCVDGEWQDYHVNRLEVIA